MSEDNHNGNGKVLVLEQIRPSHQEFSIGRNVQFGRKDTLEWAVKDREIPREFRDLEKAIQVMDSIFVSRNHAGIVYISGQYYVFDLNSANGTFLNGEKLESPYGTGTKLAPLHKGDTIRLARDLELHVKQITGSEQNHHALLVGHPGWNLRGVKEDLDQLTEQLEKRGFRGNIVTLYDESATKSNVLGALANMAYRTTASSHFLFHYSGHGGRKGMELGLHRLSPSELYSALGNIQGKKAVVLDSCHAGVFINEENKPLIPKGSLVIAGSSEGGFAFESKTMLADGRYMGRFTAEFVRYLDQHRESQNLKELGEKIAMELAKKPHTCQFFGYHYQEPGQEGSNFTVLAARTQAQSF